MDKKKFLITYAMTDKSLIEIVVHSDMTKKQMMESLQRELMSAPKFFVVNESHIINKEKISFVECEMFLNG